MVTLDSGRECRENERGEAVSTFQPSSRNQGNEHKGVQPVQRLGQKVWSELTQTEMTKMSRVGSVLGRLAPKPGSLVYLTSGKVSLRANGSEAVVFSAFDASTHLQVARVYLTESFASAVDFVDFIRQKFPFSISRIRTMSDSPFLLDPLRPKGQRFTAHLEAQGVVHSMLDDLSRDDLFSVFIQLAFTHSSDGPLQFNNNQELMREFITYLFYHNNCRTFPSLKGWTPIQKLSSYDGFEDIESFDPFAIEQN